MAKKTPQSWRTLVIFALVAAVLYGLAALGGTWKPRLGLDLEGGTQITLVAVGHPSKTKMDQAASIIDQRVNGSGVTESQVSTEGGTNIVVQIPGKTRQDLVDAVKRTAQMRFRIEAYCTSLTGSFCESSGLPSKKGSSSSPSPSSSPSSSPSTSPSTSPTSTPTTSPSSKASTKAGSKSGKTSNKSSNKSSKKASAKVKADQRAAPSYELRSRVVEAKKKAAKKTGTKTGKKTGSPSGKATATSTPSAGASSTATPSTTKPDPGAAVSNYLAWSKDPGTDWQLLWAVSRCDGKSGTALVPPIANTMSVKHPLSEAALEKQVGTLKPKDLVPARDLPNRPLISCDTSGTKYLLSVAPINGTQLKSASAGQDSAQSLGAWIVQLTFKGSARSTFANLSREMWSGATGTYANGKFAIVLDGSTIEAAGFSGVIPNGQAQITGGFTETSAKSLAQSLKYGALPVRFQKDVSTQTIGPSLAGNQLRAGILAGVVGLAIVMIYCLLYYRGLGLVVIASLLIAAAVTYSIVLLLAKTAGFTLTLPGIAGLIVAVGITADSFIVYFERIRDEMRAGKSMRVAVQAGWVRARNTCLAADSVSFLAALILYIFAIGVVRGFAFALGVSTLIDIVVFFFFTHPMITLLSTRRFFNTGHRLSGLSAETLGIDGEPGYVGGKA